MPCKSRKLVYFKHKGTLRKIPSRESHYPKPPWQDTRKRLPTSSQQTTHPGPGPGGPLCAVKIDARRSRNLASRHHKLHRPFHNRPHSHFYVAREHEATGANHPCTTLELFMYISCKMSSNQPIYLISSRVIHKQRRYNRMPASP